MSTNLYVGNLSFRTTDDDLAQLFGQFGQVVSAKVIIDRETNRPRGFGFVEMAQAEEAQKAVEGLDQKDFMGRTLKVNLAKPREDRPRRGGGGGGGGGGGWDRGSY
jgi:RNA recognition motif-containing protein